MTTVPDRAANGVQQELNLGEKKMADPDKKFPRWLAPVFGLGLGVLLMFRGLKREGPVEWQSLVGGALMGILAGGFLWLLDSPSPRNPQPPSKWSSLLAGLAVIPGFLPFIGFLFNIPAFIVNWKVKGWQNQASRLGLGLCMVMTAIIVGTMMMPMP